MKYILPSANLCQSQRRCEKSMCQHLSTMIVMSVNASPIITYYHLCRPAITCAPSVPVRSSSGRPTSRASDPWTRPVPRSTTTRHGREAGMPRKAAGTPGNEAGARQLAEVFLFALKFSNNGKERERAHCKPIQKVLGIH